MSEVMMIPVSNILPNPVAIRTVEEESESFLQLKADIQQNGLLTALTVRPYEGKFCVVEGNNRYHAIKALLAEGHPFPEIPCLVQGELSTGTSIRQSLAANIQRIDMKNSDIRKTLLKIVADNANITTEQLAAMVNKSTAYVSKMLNISRSLDETILTQVDDGTIPLENALALGKLPKSLQTQLIDAAISESKEDFASRVQAQLQAFNSGKSDVVNEYHHKIKVRKQSEIESADCEALAGKFGTKAAVVKNILDWVLTNDAESIAVGKAQWEEKKALAEQSAKEKKEQSFAKQVEELKSNPEKLAKYQALLAAAGQ